MNKFQMYSGSQPVTASVPLPVKPVPLSVPSDFYTLPNRPNMRPPGHTLAPITLTFTTPPKHSTMPVTKKPVVSARITVPVVIPSLKPIPQLSLPYVTPVTHCFYPDVSTSVSVFKVPWVF
jgi:hypothetical protein